MARHAGLFAAVVLQDRLAAAGSDEATVAQRGLDSKRSAMIALARRPKAVVVRDHTSDPRICRRHKFGMAGFGKRVKFSLQLLMSLVLHSFGLIACLGTIVLKGSKLIENPPCGASGPQVSLASLDISVELIPAISIVSGEVQLVDDIVKR